MNDVSLIVNKKAGLQVKITIIQCTFGQICQEYFFQMIVETFGEYIRKLRESEEMPLRKLAAALDIDQSTLSKIERNERRPTVDMVPALAKTFGLQEDYLMVGYLTDKITYELTDQETGLEALKRATRQLKFQIRSKNK